jgi:drug/metabolite transporter (DMT)-like permease
MMNFSSMTVRVRRLVQERSVAAGYGFAMAGALLFSTKTIVIKLAYAAGSDAETMQALRMVISLPIYLAVGLQGIAAFHRRGEQLPSGARLLAAATVGLLGYYVSSYLDLKGLESISAQLERLILFTYPFFVVIFGAVFFHQRLTSKSLLAMAVSYGGLGILFAPGAPGRSESLFGAVLVLLAAMSFACAQLLAKRAVATMGARLFTCVAMTAASAAALIQFLIAYGIHSRLPPPHIVAFGFILAIAGTVLPSFLMNAALTHISAQANAAIGAVSPVATIVLAAFFLGETSTAASALGGLMVIFGIAWFTLTESNKQIS